MKHKTARRIVRQFDRIADAAGKTGQVMLTLSQAVAKTSEAMTKHFGRKVSPDEVLEAIETVSTKKEKSQCR